jgi:glycosyltransferase involved in cell wall biosynthesis
MNATWHESGALSSGVLRICHLGKFYPPAPGGIETHVKALAKAQAELGAEVEVLCVNHAAATGQDISWTHFGRSDDQSNWDEKVLVRRVGRIAGAGRYELCPSLWGALRRVARTAHVIHVHAPNATMFVALLGRRLKGRLVVTHHSDILRFPSLARAFTPIERRVLDRAALVLSDSEQYIVGSPVLRSVAHKVRALPLGLDLAPYLDPAEDSERFAKELIERHGAPLWLSVGRLVPYKGLAFAIRALERVPGKLIIVGDGPLKDSLRALTAELGLTERVVWLNRLNDAQLVGAYRAARALWFPSIERSEAFGLVQVEAMASGCPVINTFVPGSAVSWVSQHEVSGLSVPHSDSSALAFAARRLLDDEPLRQRLSKGARERAQAEFTAELMARRSLELYQGVLVRP